MSLHHSLLRIRAVASRPAIASRAFSTSLSRTTEAPPPESPSSIKIPKADFFEQEEQVAPTRGHLPIPRQVFHPSEGDRKVTEEYLAKTIPEPSSDASKEPAREGSSEEWRRKMATLRRENLKTGLEELWARKQARDTQASNIKAAKALRNKAALQKPEPQSEILTRNTLLTSRLLDTAVRPDPQRMERVEESRQRTQNKIENERFARQNHVIDLYLKATDFIVTEAQLQARIDHLFSEDYWRMQNVSLVNGNAWASFGAPVSTDALAHRSINPSTFNNNNSEMQRNSSTKTAMLQKDVAQQLIGGKIF